jgi:hypothetical protein
MGAYMRDGTPPTGGVGRERGDEVWTIPTQSVGVVQFS